MLGLVLKSLVHMSTIPGISAASNEVSGGPAKMSGAQPIESAGLGTMVRAVRGLCSRERLFPSRSDALVMVSGGQDSLTVLEMLATGLLGPAGPSSVQVLHVNHHLRGEESEADEALVRRHCARLGVEVQVADRPVKKSEGNVQEVARLARREAALDAAEKLGLDRIVLGHTADDQVETMLYRMGKYAGLPAMRGMLPQDPPWVRPLLVLRRRDTEEFCRQKGIEFAVDRGNAYPGYARTGIRQEVIPAWERALPGAVESAARTAAVVAEVESLVDCVLASCGVEIGSTTIDVNRLLVLPVPARRLLLHKWLEEHGLRDASRSQVLAVESLLHHAGSSSVSIGSNNSVLREYDRLVLVEHPRDGARRVGDGAEVPGEVALSLPGAVEWRGARISAEQVPVFFAPDPAREAYLDAGSVGGPLTVRAPLPGDRIHPLGAPGSRKLQDVFVDLHVPASKRRLVPLVVSDGEILWVCGSVSSEKGRIRGDTRRIIKFSVDFPTPA